jgi:hypothetical protein
MAKVRDDEVESSGNGDGRQASDIVQSDFVPLTRGARSNRQAPAFEVQMSAPWERLRSLPAMQNVSCRVPTRVEEVTRVVEDRSRVHIEWIREEARTKRLALIIGAILFVVGCQVIVFAPSGRETVAAIVGAAMLVVAAGTAGYRRVWGRTPLISVGAGDAEPSVESSIAGIELAKSKRRRLKRG